MKPGDWLMLLALVVALASLAGVSYQMGVEDKRIREQQRRIAAMSNYLETLRWQEKQDDHN